MSAKKSTKTKAISKSKPKRATRTFEAEANTFQSLRLIAAPNPKDDLDPDEIMAYAQEKSHSPEIIQQLIDYIRHL